MNRLRTPLPEYDGLYSIDSDGNVYSEFHGNSRRLRIMKPFLNNSGYYRIGLFDGNGKRRVHYVHRLVAETFIPNPSNLPTVNHIDGNKLNNRVDNLEWCTQSENVKHSVRTGRQKCVRVNLENIDTGETIRFPSMRQASEYLGKYSNYIELTRRKLKQNEFREGSFVVKVVM